MLALILCVIAFGSCLMAGRRSLTLGLIAVATVGYFYGIARANLPGPASHFMFDAGVGGLYLAAWMRPLNAIQRYRMRAILPWFVVLTIWPALLFFLPIQDPLIQLVGLRGQILFLPFLLIAVMLDGEDLYTLALSLAVLNLVALGFAGAEWKLGVWQFFPRNAVTELIYRSADVLAPGKGMRIPATFVNSAAYAGTMVTTMPLLLGAWSQRRRADWQRYLLMAAIAGSALGVFMAASRTHAAVLMILVAGFTLFGNSRRGSRAVWIMMVLGVGVVVARAPTLQRFTTLRDTNFAERRLTSSLNSNFVDLAESYPLGNGLGAGGTSLPYFLQERLQNPVKMENEYARIMLEQGIPGLCFWLAFLAWLLTRPIGRRDDPWYLTRWMSRLTCAVYFVAASTGTGMLTSIPGTPLLLLLGGLLAARRPAVVRQTVSSDDTFSDLLPVRRYGW